MSLAPAASVMWQTEGGLGNDDAGKLFDTGPNRQEPPMNDDTEIEWHREQITKNRALLDELETGNTAGGDVFPETQSQIDRLKAQIDQSALIVAAHEKGTTL